MKPNNVYLKENETGTTKMNDAYGCTKCTETGQERYEYYTGYRGRELVQYDYRHQDGDLFSCVAVTLDACRDRRDNWLKTK